MTASSSVSFLETLKAQQNFYTQMQIEYERKYETVHKQLSKQQSFEEKYEEAYDKCYYGNDGNNVKLGSEELKTGDATAATKYAKAKSPNYNPSLLSELEELDVEYDSMQTMYESMLEMINAQTESAESKASTECQKTHIISGS